jgi:hypothetical protein
MPSIDLDRRAVLAGIGTVPLAARARAALPRIGEGSRIEMTIGFRRDGRLRGRERVTYTLNRDGTTTMSARSESFDPAVVRDVVYQLGADHRPAEVFVRITNGGVPEGAGLYRFAADHALLDGSNAKRGRVSERFPLAGPVKAFVAHPVATDVMVCIAADRTRPGAVVPASGVYLSSADPYGRSGPEFTPADVAVAFLGNAPLPTPVGKLPADHFLLYLRGEDGAFAPFQDLWCLERTAIFLRAFARPPVATSYGLETLEVISAP